MKKKQTAAPDGLVPLSQAIRLMRKKHPWWPETSIRDAVVSGHIPSQRASLRPKAKYFVRLSDMDAHVERLKVTQVEPPSTETSTT